ncbi:MAG: glycoside hydrolase family 3 C-terminal domain-containing protein [Ignavibacteria bacterium]|nr:glycoside hydrolase family 3 C-terminal domain-containing protein [Ignavibacteria bacterium]
MFPVSFFRVCSACLLLFLCVEAPPVAAQDTAPYTDARLDPARRAADLLSRMTTEEKIAQLQCAAGEGRALDSALRSGVGHLATPLRRLGPAEAAAETNRLHALSRSSTRLAIPPLIHDEGVHGLVGPGATVFPQAIGLAATWDPDLLGRVASAIAREARSRGIRQLLAPVINIARDARWGRVEETYGEDPWLSARLGVAFCRALESRGVLSTPKHFAGNAGDGGRDSHPVHYSERLLREVYFPAFEACVREAGASSVMAAYNSLDGIPCSVNRHLLTDVLRRRWGFDGFVVSDYGSVGGVLDLHHTAVDAAHTAKAAIEAGLEVEYPGVYIFGALSRALDERLLSVRDLDTAVSRVLRVKFRLGLFEEQASDATRAVAASADPAHRALALEAARASLVLLKNEGGALPLRKEVRAIALLGPMADAVATGGYSGFGARVVTLLEGLRARAGSAIEIRAAKGCDLGTAGLPPVAPKDVTPAGEKDGVHGWRAEYFAGPEPTGTPTLLRIDSTINFDWGGEAPALALPADRFSVRWTATLTPADTRAHAFTAVSDDGIRVWIDGKPVVDSWVNRGPSTDAFTVKLVAGRTVEVRVEYFENGGGASAILGWDGDVHGDPAMDSAVAIAASADAAVIAVGISEGEGRDRADLGLPGKQAELIRRVAATGVPTVVVLVAGAPVTMSEWIDDVPAVLDAWYPGEEGGTAVAEALFGDISPGGKLPVTFPRSSAQTPLYANAKPSGRGYDYVNLSGKPLFPFGHGLSYASFAYENARVESPKVKPADDVTVSVDVRNTGARSADEVVQLYLHRAVASVARPMQELQGFRRITLQPGEVKTVTFTLPAAQLSFLDADMKPVNEPGELELLLGASSADIRARATVTVAE